MFSILNRKLTHYAKIKMKNFNLHKVLYGGIQNCQGKQNILRNYNKERKKKRKLYA